MIFFLCTARKQRKTWVVKKSHFTLFSFHTIFIFLEKARPCGGVAAKESVNLCGQGDCIWGAGAVSYRVSAGILTYIVVGHVQNVCCFTRWSALHLFMMFQQPHRNLPRSPAVSCATRGYHVPGTSPPFSQRGSR